MSDSEDEAQDWDRLDAQVLKRGEKDHAPDGTLVQSSALERSREAMYRALARPATSHAKHMVECDWDPVKCRGIIRKVKGNYFTTMGWSESTATYVHPEEIIYLVQRGSMICYYDKLPLTLEGLTAILLPFVSTEKLLVYSYLKRLGYVVRRARANHNVPQKSVAGDQTLTPVLALLSWFLGGKFMSRLSWRPYYTSYAAIYRDLRWVRAKPLATTDQANRIDYFVWKPSTKFKRSQPPKADFEVRVFSADDEMPVSSELEGDFANLELTPSTKSSIVSRMREGCRSLIYVVVDNGVISFMRVSEPQIEQLT